MVDSRRKVSALENLEIREKEASRSGPSAFREFKDSLKEVSLRESPELGANLVSGDGSSGSSSSSSSSDTSDSDSLGSDDSDMGDDLDGVDDIDSTGEEASEEDGEEPSDEDTDSEEEDKSDEEEEPEVKKESFRSLSFLPSEDPGLRMESIFSDEDGHGFISKTWHGLSFVVGALATAGIQFAPIILGGMFKIVLYTFAKTFIVLNELFSEAASRFRRYLHNTERQKSAIASLKKKLAELKTSKVEIDVNSRLSVDVSALVTAGSNDLTENVRDYCGFFESKITTFQKTILGEFDNLKVISNARYLEKSFDPIGAMTIYPSKIGFEEKIPSKDDPDNNLCCFSMGEMIGQVEIHALIPEVRFDTWKTAEKAYGASKIYLVASANQFQQKAPLMELKQLEEFVIQLDMLADISLRHQKLFLDISQSRSGVVNSVKQLFIKLCEENTKVSFKNSVVLPLHLKSSFVTKVYMTGAMDLHDHTARVIANGLSYCESMTRLYHVSQKT